MSMNARMKLLQCKHFGMGHMWEHSHSMHTHTPTLIRNYGLSEIMAYSKKIGLLSKTSPPVPILAAKNNSSLLILVPFVYDTLLTSSIIFGKTTTMTLCYHAVVCYR